MLSHDDMLKLQAEHHDLVTIESFRSEKQYVLHLMHQKPYEIAGEIARNKRALDFGCNIGYGSAILNKTSQSVTAVDVSPQAIAAAKARYGASGIQFRVIDGHGLALEGERFDVISSFQVIEHIVDVGSYMRQLRRLLTADGLVVLTTPNAVLRVYPGMRPWNRFHVREYTAAELETLMKQSFKYVEIYGLFADEPLYSIERNRVTRRRERGRIKQEKERKFAYRSIRKLKPLQKILLLDKLKAARKSRRKQSVVDPAFVERYSTSNFRYLADDLDNALDLLAICSESADRLAYACKQLTPRSGC
ncbi:MAG: class I SAM-dependent methyltransferase [Gammaproteobacteria bacterium]|jgi:2-polyprenyl-3-methyl-5-hydroxy-6-metoxy-1,4-benzoquinol methylase|nr:class I SAM-dependent methyltransferase [Gammaproteobacteria bacterium]